MWYIFALIIWGLNKIFTIFKNDALNCILWFQLLGVFIKDSHGTVPVGLTDDESPLVQVMAWCHQAPSHYLNQWWPCSLTHICVTVPLYVNSSHDKYPWYIIDDPSSLVWPWYRYPPRASHIHGQENWGKHVCHLVMCVPKDINDKMFCCVIKTASL